MEKENSGALYLRCRERQIDAGVGTQAYLGNSGQSSKVLFRINSEPPVKTTWLGSTNGKATFADHQFINLLPNNGTLFVRIHNFRGEPHDLTFELGDVGAVRDKVVAACRRSVPAPKPRPQSTDKKISPQP